MALPYILQGNNLTVVIGSKTFTISKTHITFEKVIAAIKAGDWDTVKDIVDPKKVVLNYGKGYVSIQGEKVFWKDCELHNAMSKRMVQMIQEEFPVEPLVAFMENLYENPSFRAVNELYGFLEKNNLPITPDGCFLAYKKVDGDYLDCYSHTVLNKVAADFTDEDKEKIAKSTANGVTVQIVDDVTTVTMERNSVNDNKDQTCSEGLHFCSQDYLNHFGGEHTMILKINPRDVVSIPSDYNDSKGRCCQYQIIGELGVEPAEAFTAPVQETANTPE